ncbi:Transcriptional regulator, LuxR family protein [Minicystis rosea]|nr:Transcriptional regulator, LuxR family protein [Minicystis rosea]
MHHGARAPQTELGPVVPEPTSSFVGREAELMELATILERGERLVTVLGPAGIGKTRLALRFARGVSGGRRVVVADLMEAASLRDLATAIVRPLGVAASSSASDDDTFAAIGRSLASVGPLLLVLDNLETLAAHAAPAVAALLGAAPEVQVLATSRELLRAQGEVVVELTPLPFPAPEERAPERFAAVQLLYERARAVAPGWGKEHEDVPTVAAIARQLEGFPLAIELCARRSRLLSPAELLERLTRGHDVLAAGPRDAAGRHRTLARAIDLSVQLLAPTMRAAFAQCSVFAGASISPRQRRCSTSMRMRRPSSTCSKRSRTDRSCGRVCRRPVAPRCTQPSASTLPLCLPKAGRAKPPSPGTPPTTWISPTGPAAWPSRRSATTWAPCSHACSRRGLSARGTPSGPRSRSTASSRRSVPFASTPRRSMLRFAPPKQATSSLRSWLAGSWRVDARTASPADPPRPSMTWSEPCRSHRR